MSSKVYHHKDIKGCILVKSNQIQESHPNSHFQLWAAVLQNVMVRGVWKSLLTLCLLAGKDFLEVSFPYWKEGIGKKIWVCLNCLRILTWDYFSFSTCFQVPEQQQVVGKKISNSITGNSIIETIPFITHIKRSFMLQCPWAGDMSCLLLIYLTRTLTFLLQEAFSDCPKEDRRL